MKKTIMIAGAAGGGINTSELFLERMLKREGFFVLSYKNYMSRVRGGFNYATITLGIEMINSCEEHADIYIALNQEAFDKSQMMIKRDGIIIASDQLKKNSMDQVENVFWIEQEPLKSVSNSKNAFSMCAIGVVIKKLGLEREMLNGLRLNKWSEEVNQTNLAASTYGYDLLEGAMIALKTSSKEAHILVNGNQAVALGAIASGLGFYSAYPMAPSTGIMTYLAAHEREMGLIVEQAEDEIAAMMAAIGAASNGVRAMTGTSGGGFALMVEALGFAAVSEVPLVVCNVQRPGPATGLPTRTEQADLAFVVSASQGEFARIVLAPLTVEDAFYTTFRAFNLAEKYQVPVIILTDQFLADSTQTVPRFKTNTLKIERHLMEAVQKDYKRYDFNQVFGGRKYPGIDDQTLVMTDSHVHDEYGSVTEDEQMTIALKNKMIRRIEAIKEELNAPHFYGAEAYKTLFVCWGSTFGALKDAVDALNDQGESVAMLAFSDVFPIKSDVFKDYLKANVKLINVEGNAYNQFGKILRMETGITFDKSINKYDGRPFNSSYIIESYRK
ncbi:2-oxoacid:acceptor oxidoreductase subunit alpha [Fusibacter ferrireducens]|uniref:2-oxoacid:acceptor oxidoreductase subunit alpha n=1 Tax=Fusibacter ferrireducens TaxID=2785058 RepID=A0ABR9ZXY3_9FIRM|nr:2-oxoacid:acceptor oxidoreductase subunit alpha [Fusibacter ferrireducens]MBF4695318.1 2-oxoacid:acceptor oxidoreductase subunit alpha [Fusibacter ferrireducens]